MGGENTTGWNMHPPRGRLVNIGGILYAPLAAGGSVWRRQNAPSPIPGHSAHKKLICKAGARALASGAARAQRTEGDIPTLDKKNRLTSSRDGRSPGLVGLFRGNFVCRCSFR